MGEERAIFESFIRAYPDLLDEPIKDWFVLADWYRIMGLQRPKPPYHDRPDIICVTESGRRVGVELKAWINEEQIAKAKLQAMFEENILRAIGRPLPSNDTAYLKGVVLKGRPRRFNKQDSEEFRSQLFELIRQADDKWRHKARWDQTLKQLADFAAFPMVAKYLTSVELVPDRSSGGAGGVKKFPYVHWIRFPYSSCHFKLEDMLETLRERFSVTTDERYENICNRVGLNEVFLLLHYDLRAFEYNSGIDAPNWSFKDTEAFAKKTLGGCGGYFNKVFLFYSLPGQENVCRVY
jgi:hypothetical protein